jgi:hypothetical protein
MKDTNLLFKDVSYTLGALLDSIEMGIIGLPDIQRPFVWKNTAVRDLLDSMYRGYPVGSLLFWQNGHAGEAASAGNGVIGTRAIGTRAIGTVAKQKAAELLIVDGQQRLTALYAVVKDRQVLRQDYTTEYIWISFHPLEERFEVADAATRRDRYWIADISRLWAPDTDLFELVDDYLEKLREVHEVSSDEVRMIRRAIQKLQNLRNYPFHALELLANVDAEQVSQVFVRINSKGKRLSEADFILTLMSVYWDEGRHELEAFCRSARIASAGLTPYNHFLQPSPDQLLRVAVGFGFKRGRLHSVYSLLRGKDLDSGEFSSEQREVQFARLQQAQATTLHLQNWKDFLKCLLQAGYRSNKVITSDTTVLYAYVFYLIGKEEWGVPVATLRRVMARWFFFASLTGRYTSSPESALESDLIQLREVKDGDGFLAFLERSMTAGLTEDFWRVTLPNDLYTSSPRSPSLMSYLAALCVLDAKVLFSDLKVASLLDPTTDAYRNSLERHHLFPKDWLKRNGYDDLYWTNQIANYALVEWPDNANISNRPPAEYWPLFQDRYDALEWALCSDWHALPQNWENLPYEEFLTQRRVLMAGVIREGFEAI